MKRIITLCLMLLLFMTVKVEAKDIGILIDGKEVQFTESSGRPFADENSRTQVPLRVTMESFGANVDWDQNTQTAIVSSNGIIVKVPMNQQYILVNGNKTTIDTKSVVVNQRIYLPIRFVLEAFGANVDWDQTNFNVVINSNGRVGNNNTSSILGKYRNATFDLETFTVTGANKGYCEGFFISSDGYAVVKFSVVNGAHFYCLTTRDGKKYTDIKLVDYDETHDVAKIKVNGGSFNYINVASSDNVLNNDDLYIITAPDSVLAYNVSAANNNVKYNNTDCIKIIKNNEMVVCGAVVLNTDGEAIGMIMESNCNAENVGASLYAIKSKYINAMKSTNDQGFIYREIYYPNSKTALDFGVFTNSKVLSTNPYSIGTQYKYYIVANAIDSAHLSSKDVWNHVMYSYKELLLSKGYEFVPTSGDFFGLYANGAEGVIITCDEYDIITVDYQVSPKTYDHSSVPDFGYKYNIPCFFQYSADGRNITYNYELYDPELAREYMVLYIDFLQTLSYSIDDSGYNSEYYWISVKDFYSNLVLLSVRGTQLAITFSLNR